MNIFLLRFLSSILMTVVIISSQTAWSAELRVIATIKPVHSLVASVMAGVGRPELLIKGAGSPHNFSLSPSDARSLSKADIVFWLGEELEAFLARSLRNLAPAASVVELSRTPGLELLTARPEGVWEERAKKHNETDPHFWLNPDNAIKMIDEIVRNLSLADKNNAFKYAANGTALSLRLNSLTGELEAILDPVKTTPYIIYHDAFQYFEKRFNLNVIGAVTPNPDRSPGVRSLFKLREKIATDNIPCVFAGPQVNPARIKTITRSTSARMAILDPLGVDIPAGPAAYAALLRAMARSLVSCLGQRH